MSDTTPPGSDAFHFSDQEAAAVGREPAGRGRFGPPEGGPTPGRTLARGEEGVGIPADQPSGPELHEFGKMADGREVQTDGVSIFVPPKPGILAGQLMLDAGAHLLPINIVDPRGCPWEDGKSNAFVAQLLDEFLAASGARWLQFTDPIERHHHLVSRYAAESVLQVHTVRIEMKEPPVPTQTAGGIPVVRQLGPNELARMFGA